MQEDNGFYKPDEGHISGKIKESRSADAGGVIDRETPENYLPSPGLVDAVNVALALGQPLLVTGEPGTGKTRLAHSIAHELNLGDPLVFNTKTTSTARDLFYQYDALRRFQDVQFDDRRPVEDYISCQALGTAILMSNPVADARSLLPKGVDNPEPAQNVVLVDEIDKAPRDLPNDVLNEVERMEFTIHELGESGRTFYANEKLRPILVLTSNSEKNLPDAFLRRCIFYHIPFPKTDELRRIVIKRFGHDPDFTTRFISQYLDPAIAHFLTIRKRDLKKPPATAEFLSWVRVIHALGVNMKTLEPGEDLKQSYTILAKTRDDLKRLRKTLGD